MKTILFVKPNIKWLLLILVAHALCEKDFWHFHLTENILQISAYLMHFTDYLVIVGCDLQQCLEEAVLLG